MPLTALEVMLLQHLSQAEGLGPAPRSTWPAQGQPDPQVWARLERLLRQWTQDYLERPIRSAALIDVCLASV